MDTGLKVAAAAAAESSWARVRGVGSALALLLAWLVVLAPRPAGAEDRITVRGNYYREESTRVMQPMVHFRKELPDERFALEAEYLLDMISSASIAAAWLESASSTW